MVAKCKIIYYNTHALYGELARFPLYIARHVRMVKYWFNLLGMKRDNSILKSITTILIREIEINENIANWSSRDILQNAGFYDSYFHCLLT